MMILKVLLLCLNLHAFDLGVNTHMDCQPHLSKLHEINATWIRSDFNWSAIEPQRDKWDWAATDAIVANARRLNLNVYAAIVSVPSWTSSNGLNTGVPNQVDWMHFIDVLSNRYSNYIGAYGILNEPNLEEFWMGSTKDYVDIMLRPAYPIIHHNAPTAVVAAPDLAHLYSARLGIDGFFKDLPPESFDVLSHHVYGSTDLKSKLYGFKFMGIGYKPGLIQMIQRFPGKEVWITECGDRSEDEKQQAAVISLQLKEFSKIPAIKKVFLFHFMDSEGDKEKWGLLRPDESPKLIWSVLRHE